MKILVLDVGGTHVKMLATAMSERKEFESGKSLTAEHMIASVCGALQGVEFDRVSMGYPGPVLNDRIVTEPAHLGPGWRGFDFPAAFRCPVKIVNDASMQAFGAYEGGKMLFLGLGTSLGTAFIDDGTIQGVELGHLPFKKGLFEDYMGSESLKRDGKKKWRHHVFEIIESLVEAIQPEYTVIGGGNAEKLKELPAGCRLGCNDDAFTGGFRLWDAGYSKSANEAFRKDRPPSRKEGAVKPGPQA